MANLFEADDYLVTLVIAVFMIINFSQEIGMVYFGIVVLDWIGYFMVIYAHPYQSYPLEISKEGRGMSLVWAGAIYAAFIFIASMVSMRFMVTPTNLSAFEQVSSLLGTTFSATPILYTNPYIKLAVWGIFIAFTETRAFFRTLLQWGIAFSGKAIPSLFSYRALFVCVFFGIFFMMFHIVAKGITDNAALSVTFVFGSVSAASVIYFRQYLEAAFLHIITNTNATMQSLGIGFFATGDNAMILGAAVLGGVIIAAWVLLFRELPLINTVKRYV